MVTGNRPPPTPPGRGGEPGGAGRATERTVPSPPSRSPGLRRAPALPRPQQRAGWKCRSPDPPAPQIQPRRVGAARSAHTRRPPPGSPVGTPRGAAGRAAATGSREGQPHTGEWTTSHTSVHAAGGGRPGGPPPPDTAAVRQGTPRCPRFTGGGHRARAKVRRPLEGLAESGDGGPCAPPPAAPSDSPSMRSRSASTAGRGRRGSAWAVLGAARAPTRPCG